MVMLKQLKDGINMPQQYKKKKKKIKELNEIRKSIQDTQM